MRLLQCTEDMPETIDRITRYLSRKAAYDDMLLHVYASMRQECSHLANCVITFEAPLQSLVARQTES